MSISSNKFIKEFTNEFLEDENISFWLAVNSGAVAFAYPFRFQTPISSILKQNHTISRNVWHDNDIRKINNWLTENANFISSDTFSSLGCLDWTTKYRLGLTFLSSPGIPAIYMKPWVSNLNWTKIIVQMIFVRLGDRIIRFTGFESWETGE